MKSFRVHRRTGPSRLSQGVSLIEALVALAVMAIGLLGVAGMQTTLRSTADLSKQRSEAVRLAQEKLEDLRSFGELVVPTGSTERDYAGIVTPAPEVVTSSANTGFANTVFTRTVTVTAPSATQPRFKTVRVKVGWYDRVGDATNPADERTVELYSTIAQVAPELGATLGVPANTSGPQSPGGRHVTIPRAAVDQGNGTSIFTPPGGAGVTWTFVNATGWINNVCTPAGTCVGTTSVLLSGYVRFATGPQPSQAEAETPTDPLVPLGVEVTLTDPVLPTPTRSCFTDSATSSTYVAYYCVVPIVPVLAVVATYTWSGASHLNTLPLATSSTDNSSSRFRVCRYTPDPTTNTPAAGNVAHPLNYASVGTSLVNQNFLVISAGDGIVGSAPFTCPGSSSNPLINSNTRLHQP